MPAASPLRARDLTVDARPADRARRRRPRRRRRRAHRRRRPQRRRQVDAAAGARRAGAARARSRRAHAADRHGRLPAAGTVALGRDGRRLPRPPHRRHRRDHRDGRGDGRPGRRRRRAPTTATPSPSSGGWRSAAPTSTPASGRCGPTSGCRPGCSTSRPRRCPAARRLAPGWPRCCWPASTCSCSTSRPTTSTSPASTGSSGGSRSCRRPSCSSATTARSSPAPSPTCSSSTSSPTGPRCSAAAGRPTSTSARWRGGRRGSASRSTTRSGAALAGRAQREREWATQGLSKVKQSADDEPDKNIRAFKINQTEQLAGRAGAHGEGDGAARRRRQAARAVAAAPVGRLARAQRRCRRPPRRSGRRTWRLHARADRPRRRRRASAIALVGANGSGKTTLLDALLGRSRAVRRYAATLGPSVVVGEIEQARDRLVRVDHRAARVPGRHRHGRRPTSARCSPSSASSPTT